MRNVSQSHKLITLEPTAGTLKKSGYYVAQESQLKGGKCPVWSRNLYLSDIQSVDIEQAAAWKIRCLAPRQGSGPRPPPTARRDFQVTALSSPNRGGARTLKPPLLSVFITAKSNPGLLPALF